VADLAATVLCGESIFALVPEEVLEKLLVGGTVCLTLGDEVEDTEHVVPPVVWCFLADVSSMTHVGSGCKS
jgi:hypothetical protein